MITVSIISHLHGSMLPSLINQLISFGPVSQIILTINVPERLNLVSHPKLKVIYNDKPLGFGANHNQAFKHCQGDFFCPLNPDITIRSEIFSELLHQMQQHSADVVAPLIVSASGQIEDSVRYFPTPLLLLKKALTGHRGTYALTAETLPFSPEWIAGMFLLFKRDSYKDLVGFDESFFLYYEDVDICVRLWKTGKKLLIIPHVAAIHDARRDSHKHFWHGKQHMMSMLRYLFKHLGRLPSLEKQRKAT